MTRECVGGQRQGAGVVWGCRPQQETPEVYRGRFTEWVWGKYVELAETALGCEPAACRSENGRWGKLQPGTQITHSITNETPHTSKIILLPQKRVQEFARSLSFGIYFGFKGIFSPLRFLIFFRSRLKGSARFNMINVRWSKTSTLKRKQNNSKVIPSCIAFAKLHIKYDGTEVVSYGPELPCQPPL